MTSRALITTSMRETDGQTTMEETETVQNPLTIITISICTFYIANNYVWSYLAPNSARKTKQQLWKWRNIFNSMSHATISSIGSIGCLLYYPEIAKDLISTHTSASYGLVAFSYGYFIEDAVEILLHNPSRSSYEVLFHHTFVYFAFGTALYTRMYVGFAIVSLVIEVNSVTLHIRQLLIIQGFSRAERIYRINSLINIATFIIFRFLLLVWMTRWIVVHRDDVSILPYTIGSIGLAVIVGSSITIFVRILNTDFIKSTQEAIKTPQVQYKVE